MLGTDVYMIANVCYYIHMLLFWLAEGSVDITVVC